LRGAFDAATLKQVRGKIKLKTNAPSRKALLGSRVPSGRIFPLKTVTGRENRTSANRPIRRRK
jgi:hypothetical protein